MRYFVPLTCLGLVLVLSSFGCASGSSNGNGAGAGGTGGTGGMGGNGGIGGGGGPVRMCSIPRDCDDNEPCTLDMCTERVCVYGQLPDDTRCGSVTGLSACVGSVCQPIWPSCAEPEAQDGDFCEPEPDPPRLGRCVSGNCEVQDCEIAFDCWNKDPCASGICDESNGTCSQGNAPNGTPCIPPAGGQCFDGVCGGGGAGGQGGQGGQGGD